MWLSQQAARRPRREPDGNTALVTIGGAQSAVQSGCELRGLACVGPAGVVWLPEQDGTVATLDLPGGETVILGALDRQIPVGMQPGEVYLYTQGASIYLRRDGSITLRGRVNVEGSITVNGESGGTQPP